MAEAETHIDCRVGCGGRICVRVYVWSCTLGSYHFRLWQCVCGRMLQCVAHSVFVCVCTSAWVRFLGNSISSSRGFLNSIKTHGELVVASMAESHARALCSSSSNSSRNIRLSDPRHLSASVCAWRERKIRGYRFD